jgi:hypothetical protein
MKVFELRLSTLLLRYYLMMLVILAAGFTRQCWLAAFELPIFYSAILWPGRKQKPNSHLRFHIIYMQSNIISHNSACR